MCARQALYLLRYNPAFYFLGSAGMFPPSSTLLFPSGTLSKTQLLAGSLLSALGELPKQLLCSFPHNSIFIQELWLSPDTRAGAATVTVPMKIIISCRKRRPRSKGDKSPHDEKRHSLRGKGGTICSGALGSTVSD